MKTFATTPKFLFCHLGPALRVYPLRVLMQCILPKLGNWIRRVQCKETKFPFITRMLMTFDLIATVFTPTNVQRGISDTTSIWIRNKNTYKYMKWCRHTPHTYILNTCIRITTWYDSSGSIFLPPTKKTSRRRLWVFKH